MAKKRARKKRARKRVDECPRWVLELSEPELARLKSLRPIARDFDTCEMPDITLKQIRTGPKQGLWLAGKSGVPPGRRRR